MVASWLCARGSRHCRRGRKSRGCFDNHLLEDRWPAGIRGLGDLNAKRRQLQREGRRLADQQELLAAFLRCPPQQVPTADESVAQGLVSRQSSSVVLYLPVNWPTGTALEKSISRAFTTGSCHLM